VSYKKHKKTMKEAQAALNCLNVLDPEKLDQQEELIDRAIYHINRVFNSKYNKSVFKWAYEATAFEPDDKHTLYEFLGANAIDSLAQIFDQENNIAIPICGIGREQIKYIVKEVKKGERW